MESSTSSQPQSISSQAVTTTNSRSQSTPFPSGNAPVAFPSSNNHGVLLNNSSNTPTASPPALSLSSTGKGDDFTHHSKSLQPLKKTPTKASTSSLNSKPPLSPASPPMSPPGALKSPPTGERSEGESPITSPLSSRNSGSSSGRRSCGPDIDAQLAVQAVTLAAATTIKAQKSSQGQSPSNGPGQSPGSISIGSGSSPGIPPRVTPTSAPPLGRAPSSSVSLDLAQTYPPGGLAAASNRGGSGSAPTLPSSAGSKDTASPPALTTGAILFPRRAQTHRPSPLSPATRIKPEPATTPSIDTPYTTPVPPPTSSRPAQLNLSNVSSSVPTNAEARRLDPTPPPVQSSPLTPSISARAAGEMEISPEAHVRRDGGSNPRPRKRHSSSSEGPTTSSTVTSPSNSPIAAINPSLAPSPLGSQVVELPTVSLSGSSPSKISVDHLGLVGSPSFIMPIDESPAASPGLSPGLSTKTAISASMQTLRVPREPHRDSSRTLSTNGRHYSQQQLSPHPEEPNEGQDETHHHPQQQQQQQQHHHHSTMHAEGEDDDDILPELQTMSPSHSIRASSGRASLRFGHKQLRRNISTFTFSQPAPSSSEEDEELQDHHRSFNQHHSQEVPGDDADDEGGYDRPELSDDTMYRGSSAPSTSPANNLIVEENELDAFRAQFTSALSSQQQTISHLQSQLDLANRDRDELRDQVRQLTSHLANSQARMDALESGFNDRLGSLDKKLASWTAQVQSGLARGFEAQSETLEATRSGMVRAMDGVERKFADFEQLLLDNMPTSHTPRVSRPRSGSGGSTTSLPAPIGQSDRGWDTSTRLARSESDPHAGKRPTPRPRPPSPYLSGLARSRSGTRTVKTTSSATRRAIAPSSSSSSSASRAGLSRDDYARSFGPIASALESSSSTLSLDEFSPNIILPAWTSDRQEGDDTTTELDGGDLMEGSSQGSSYSPNKVLARSVSRRSTASTATSRPRGSRAVTTRGTRPVSAPGNRKQASVARWTRPSSARPSM